MADLPPLPEGVSLQAWAEGPVDELVFEHAGRWLHPLFALRDLLKTRPDWAGRPLAVRDRVVGRGAAFLLADLGVRRVAAAVISRRAEDVLSRAGIGSTAGRWVERIDCQTEDLLAEVIEPGQALELLEARRRAAGYSSGS